MDLTIACYEIWLNNDESVTSSISRSSMFRDFDEKECPYFDFDVPKILDKLLEKGLIELLESRCLKENRRTNDPKYCKYHRIISHPIEKCKAFRRQVLQFVKERKITLDKEGTE